MSSNTTLQDVLRAKWRTHVQMLGNFSAEIVGKTFDNLCKSYSEPHRHYHTLTHLNHLFECFEQHADEIADPARVAFAAWYHDIIYDPRRSDNEAKSAERAIKELDNLGAGADLRSHVMQLILATKNHAAGGRDYDDDIFLDADLSILGADPETYKTYAQNIRAEYIHLDEPSWRNGRMAFLAKLSCEPRIFRTGVFEGEYGDTARENLKWELNLLARAET